MKPCRSRDTLDMTSAARHSNRKRSEIHSASKLCAVEGDDLMASVDVNSCHGVVENAL